VIDSTAMGEILKRLVVAVALVACSCGASRQIESKPQGKTTDAPKAEDADRPRVIEPEHIPPEAIAFVASRKYPGWCTAISSDDTRYREYDEAGRIVASGFGTRCANAANRDIFEYDEQGRLVAMESTTDATRDTVTIEWRDDLNPARIEARRYRGKDLELHVTLTWHDDYRPRSAIESLSRCMRPTKQDDDTMLELSSLLKHLIRHYLEAPEHEVEEHIRAAYDPHGNIIAVGVDDDGDGEIDGEHLFTYDDRCNPLGEEQIVFESGVRAVLERNRYDDSGKLIMKEEDRDGDAVIDFRTSFTFDSGGNLAAVALDEGADGSIDEEEIYEYDAEGNQTSSAHLRSGRTQQSEKRFFDDFGNVVRTETDHDGEGQYIYAKVYTYECWGAASALRQPEDSDEFKDLRINPRKPVRKTIEELKKTIDLRKPK